MTKKQEEAAGPPAYESLVLPNSRNQRAYLAGIAGDLTRAELDAKAAEVGIDMSGVRTKEDAVARVQEAARPVVINSQTQE